MPQMNFLTIRDREKDLVRLIDTAPAVVSGFWLLMHPDMRRTPRVRVFFDYVVADLTRFRKLLLRDAETASACDISHAPDRPE